MEKINFEPIGEIMTAFDTDKMDIGRRTEVINPDGTTGETNPNTPMYSGIACHISFDQVDNPDYNASGDTRPIIQMLKISCPTSIDLQNGDLITAYKMADDGKTVLDTYKGVIGKPTMSMSRQTAEMQIRTGI